MANSKRNTPGFGIEYEILTPAYFALVLNNNPDVDDFTLTSNAENFGNLDDVLVYVRMQNVEYHFGIQLKHKEEAKKLLPSSFEAKGDFNLEKYCKEFKNLKEEHKKYHFILYTNKHFNNERKREVKNFKMVQGDPLIPNVFFNTSGDIQNMYKFEITDETLGGDNVSREDYQQFLSRFSLYVCQKNFKQLEIEIKKILKYEEIFLKYINFFRRLHQGQFTNKSLDKRTLNLHLIDMFFSPFIIEDWKPPFEEKKKIALEAGIGEFDVTVLNGSNFNFNMKNEDTAETTIKLLCEKYARNFNTALDNTIETMTKQLLRLGKDYKIIDRHGKTLEQNDKMKILCYLFEKPLYIRVDQAPKHYIYDAISSYKIKENKIRFVFLGQELQAEQFPIFKTFNNLEDLLKSNYSLYQSLNENIFVSLQGRITISLQSLIDSDEDICRFIKTGDIFEMLKGDYIIGEEQEKLPQYYIPRVVSGNLLDLNSILDRFDLKSDEIFIFTNCDDKFLDLLKDQKLEIFEIDDFLENDRILSKNVIITSKTKDCPKNKFDEICKKCSFRNVHLFRRSDQDKCVSIKGSMNISESSYIEDRKIHQHFNSSINFLCAQPGMGKTTFMKFLKNNYPSDYWTILVDLKVHNSFLKKQHEFKEIFQYFFNLNEERGFHKNIKQMFLKREKIVFFLDGADELESDCIDNLCNFIKELSLRGFRIWVSSRPNLQNKLEDDLNMFSIDIEELNKQQQIKYIHNRLQDTYQLEEINEIVRKIFVDINIINNCQILGIPLQLFMLTEIFIRDKCFYVLLNENMFVLTKMYRIFFQERCKYVFTSKLGCQNTHLLPINIDDYLENYEIPALQSCLEEDIFKKLNLNLNESEKFLKEINEKGDRLGIIRKIDNESKAIFDHYSYGEYFACRFFANNCKKIRLLKQHLFSGKYRNFMLLFNVFLAEENPLHLAVIHKNIEQIDQYLDIGNIHDKGGRNPLHLACCNVTAEWPREFLYFIRDDVKLNNSIIAKLTEFDAFERDAVFGWTPMHYSFENKSYYLAEIVLKQENRRKNISDFFRDNDENVTIACHSVYFGYPNLLTALLKKGGRKLTKKFFEKYVIRSIIRTIFSSDPKIKENVMKSIKLLMDNCNINDLYPEILLDMTENHSYASKFLIEKGMDVTVTDEDGETILHHAVKNNSDIKFIEYIIQKGIEVNSQNYLGRTPLHIAVRKNTVSDFYENHDDISKNIEIIELLLENSADASITDERGFTVLHHAVLVQHVETIDILLKKGVNVNVPCKYGGTSPLYHAVRVRKGNITIVQQLLQAGADLYHVTNNGESILDSAISRGNSDIIKLILDESIAINRTYKGKITTLHNAVKIGAVEVINFLLKNGVSINERTNNGDTALHYASWYCTNREIIDLLLRNGADINAQNNQGETPLHYAIEENSVNKCGVCKIKFLLERKADSYILIENAENLLHYAKKNIEDNSVNKCSLCKITFLLKRGADSNILTENGENLLHYASNIGHEGAVKLFLKIGLNVNAANKFGETPLHLAANNGNPRILLRLLKNNGDINAVTHNGDTILHHARSKSIITLLLGKGFDINRKNNEGETALDSAIRKGLRSITQMLLDNVSKIN